MKAFARQTNRPVKRVSFRVFEMVAAITLGLFPIPALAQGYQLIQTPFNPGSINPVNGTSVNSSATVFISPVNGFTDTVIFTCTVTGPGAPLPTCTAPNSVTVPPGGGTGSPFTSTLVATASPMTPMGTYFVKVNARSTSGVEPLGCTCASEGFPLQVTHNLTVGNSGGGLVALLTLAALMALWSVWRRSKATRA